MISVGSTGLERYASKAINFDDYYNPYPMQRKYHASAKRYKLLGGAAGPGKTLALIVDHMMTCSRFGADDAPQVHTLLLRRTHPKLEATVITRFREKIPRELYRKFTGGAVNQVEWLNGATTNFGSMQHEHNAWDWQGQWLKISYDELAEFTYRQWFAPSGWNRCPVSPYAVKDGASNPIGIGAGWLKKLFVDKKPCDEMDDSQRQKYDPNDYEYFPCTYLDNPIFANDPIFLAGLEAYPAAVRDALKFGKWGVAGGYFEGAWDRAENVYQPAEAPKIERWHRRFLSCDWGFEHWAAIYWHYMDDYGILRTYRELCVKHQAPEVLAETIVKASEPDEGAKYEIFALSHDAFAHNNTKTMGQDANSVAMRMTPVLMRHGIAPPSPSTRDKVGREQMMYDLLRKRIRTGETADGHPIMQAAWQISEECPMLIDVLPRAPLDEKKDGHIAEFLGDDPLQGSGYGLYAIFGRPGQQSEEDKLRAKILTEPNDFARHLIQQKATLEQMKGAGDRWRPAKPAWQSRR